MTRQKIQKEKKIFISWSGETSKRLGGVIRNWLGKIFHPRHLFISTENIEQGDRWFERLSVELNDCNFGIFILTKNNIHSEWLHFEAGALAKNVKEADIILMLFGVRVQDFIESPLSHFQPTFFNKANIFQLLLKIHKKINSGITEDALEELFESHWINLENEIHEALGNECEEVSEISRTDRLVGYIYYCINGFEYILVKERGKYWEFPIKTPVPADLDIQQCIRKSLITFLQETKHCSIETLIQHNYSYPVVFPIKPREFEKAPLNLKENYDWVHFFKIQISHPFDLPKGYSWQLKTKLFDIHKDHDKQGKNQKLKHPSLDADLVQLLRQDRIVHEINESVGDPNKINVLDCVDIIVFRESPEVSPTQEIKYEFLLLKRKDNGKWEYPKGGLEFHEQLTEGATRELLEETGLSSMGNFIPGGNLSSRTVDVRHRGKPYQVIRVTCMTYLFVGKDNEIKYSKEHEAHAWLSLTQAKESIWIEYGKNFLEEWDFIRWEVARKISRPVSVAFQVTEKCWSDCKFCHRRIAKESTASNLDRKRVVELLARRGIRRLTFTGGEPLSIGKRELLDLIKYANSLFLHTCLSTTGYSDLEADRLGKEDIILMDSFLDQFLFPVHCVNETTARLLYQYPDKTWSRQNENMHKVLKCLSSTRIKVEISTVVCKQNKDDIIAIGEWLIEQTAGWLLDGKDRRADLIWRIEEYYPNGKQNANKGIRSAFELTDDIYQIYDQVYSKFHSEFARISLSTKMSREGAPDVMVTPLGNLVTSSNFHYELRAERNLIPVWEFKNRRAWDDYSLNCRTDWEWYNPLRE